MFPDFYGNAGVAANLRQMAGGERIPQTLLFAGPEGVGKATLARRFAAAILGEPGKIERDDLSLEANIEIVAEREKWTADKRNEDPLLFSTHPDFVTFAPDGPLRQITIPQMRLLKDRSQFKPLHGTRRIFLIDHIDRANEQAANSLLKILEEPPAHLILVLTAENAYDLLPTIRSRAVPFQFAPLPGAEMREFAKTKKLSDPQRRIALASGSPGRGVSLDLETYDQQRSAMLKLLEAGAGAATFGEWAKTAEALALKRSEKLDQYLKVLYMLLEDLLLVQNGRGEIRNLDLEPKLRTLAGKVSFAWIREAVRIADELLGLVRRNIQKSLALDAMVVQLRRGGTA
jgi:DNA polymerase-3 subunit delta'